MTDSNQISALINLLDDPDDGIYQHVKDKLISLGEDVIPQLETIWETSDFGITTQSRIEDIIQSIQFNTIKNQLKLWAATGAMNLMKGALLVNKFRYPSLNEKKVLSSLAQIRQDAWLELNEELTSLEQVKVLNHILFDVHGFNGNKNNYHDPQNSFISDVLETKKGNPLSLSILYIFIAQELGIPIYGINLPNHFVLAFMDHKQILRFAFPEEVHDDVLFYVNPFSRGTIFQRKDIDVFIKQLKLNPQESFFNPCANIDIIKRMISNLIYSYEKTEQMSKVKELKKLFEVVSNAAPKENEND